MGGLALIPTIVGLLVSVVGSVIGRILFSIGMSVVYYRGVGVAVEWLRGQFFDRMGGLPESILQFLGVLQIGTCANMLFAVLMVKLSILGLQSDYIKRYIIQ